jgi:hypothetical protein
LVQRDSGHSSFSLVSLALSSRFSIYGLCGQAVVFSPNLL